MTDDVDTGRSQSLAPDDAFTLLADPTRIKILQALGDVSEPGVPETLAFSELRQRADVSGSGRFNYHLQQLLGHFVEGTDDGYRLSYAGKRVYQSIKTGTFTERVEIEPFELEATCHVCGANQVGAYRDSMFHVRCPSCEAQFYKYFVPPSTVIDRSKTELLHAANDRIQREIGAMAKGVCPWCCARLSSRVLPTDEEMPLQENPAIEHRVLHSCETCDGSVYTRLGGLVVSHPAVVSFFYDHGVDVSERLLWSMAFASTDERTTVVSEDPWRAAVSVACAGDELRVVLDDGPSVVRVEE